MRAWSGGCVLAMAEDDKLEERLVPEGGDPEDFVTGMLMCGSPLEVIELSADKKQPGMD